MADKAKKDKKSKKKKSKKKSEVTAKTDPQLEALLDQGESDDEIIQIVCTLRTPKDDKILEPEETQAIAEHVLKTVADRVGSKPVQVNVFRNLQSFALSGSKTFVRDLLTQEEIESAMANEQPTTQEMLITPVEKQELSDDD